MWSCSRFSLPLIFNLVAASISRFLINRRYKIFMLFFKRHWSPLFFFISGSSSFFVIHANKDIKINSKERIGFVVVVFISKSPGGYMMYRRTRGYLKCKISPPLT